MKVSLPHSLGAEEVRRRMHDRAHEIGSYFPAGMATVETSWPNEDRMNLLIHAAGQRMEGGVSIYEDRVDIELDLPAMLGFLKGTLEGAIRKHGGRLLEKS